MSLIRSGVTNLNISNKCFFGGELIPSLTGVQFVRWRKGRWMPVAKSKQFRIPERRIVPKEEEVEILRLYNVYRTTMKAVRDHLERENLRTSATSVLASKQAAEEEDEHQSLMELNLQENARIAELRAKRLQGKQEADFARVLASKEKLELEELQQREDAIRIIAETQELVKTFIQREDLQKVIEAAIETPKEYNFAIDFEGYVYRGQRKNYADNEEKEHVMNVSQ